MSSPGQIAENSRSPLEPTRSLRYVRCLKLEVLTRTIGNPNPVKAEEVLDGAIRLGSLVLPNQGAIWSDVACSACLRTGQIKRDADGNMCGGSMPECEMAQSLSRPLFEALAGQTIAYLL